MSSEAIKAIGYTDNGRVGMLVIMQLSRDEAKQLHDQAKSKDGISFEANLSMDPDYCEKIAQALTAAAAQARKKNNERDRPNADQGRPTIH